MGSKAHIIFRLIFSSECDTFLGVTRGRGQRTNMAKCDMGEGKSKLSIFWVTYFFTSPFVSETVHCFWIFYKREIKFLSNSKENNLVSKERGRTPVRVILRFFALFSETAYGNFQTPKSLISPHENRISVKKRMVFISF